MSQKTDRQDQRPPHPDSNSSADLVERLSGRQDTAAGWMLDTAVHLPRDLPTRTDLTVHPQAESPGKAADAIRMRTSGDRPSFVILRLYRPQPAVRNGAWRCPPSPEWPERHTSQGG